MYQLIVKKLQRLQKKMEQTLLLEKKFLSNNHTPVTEVIKNDIEILKKTNKYR